MLSRPRPAAAAAGAGRYRKPIFISLVLLLMAGAPGAGRYRKPIFISLVLLLMAGLPVAVWLDLRQISERLLTRQAADINAIISGFRGYYAGHGGRRGPDPPHHTRG